MIVTGDELGDGFLKTLTEKLEKLYGDTEAVRLLPLESTRFGSKACAEVKQRFTDGRIVDGKPSNEELKKIVSGGEKILYVVRRGFGEDWIPAELGLHPVIMLDKFEEYGAKRENICTFVPCQPYNKQDKSFVTGEAVSVRTCRNLIMERSGLYLTVTAHDHFGEGWIDEGMYNIDVIPGLIDKIRPLIDGKAVVVAPDGKAHQIANQISHKLELPTIVLNKERDSQGHVKAYHFPDFFDCETIRDKGYTIALYCDDMILTFNTGLKSTKPAKDAGLTILYATVHPILVYNDDEQRWAYDLLQDVSDTAIASDSVLSSISKYSVIPRAAEVIHEHFKPR
ncbi:MAG: hypothetical protein HYX24_03490 [Candidatus Aenigmarchaeota archaeon]|nr:hypothetical protein [Candidatus Aenigmarchaeota archaeon]